MVGGDAAAFESARPLFDLMGATVVLQGGPGNGQRTKLVNQILIASTMVAVTEALLFAYRAGLDVAKVLLSVSSGSAGSWSLSNLATRVRAGDLAPRFFSAPFLTGFGIPT